MTTQKVETTTDFATWGVHERASLSSYESWVKLVWEQRQTFLPGVHERASIYLVGLVSI